MTVQFSYHRKMSLRIAKLIIPFTWCSCGNFWTALVQNMNIIDSCTRYGYIFEPPYFGPFWCRTWIDPYCILYEIYCIFEQLCWLYSGSIGTLGSDWIQLIFHWLVLTMFELSQSASTCLYLYWEIFSKDWCTLPVYKDWCTGLDWSSGKIRSPSLTTYIMYHNHLKI